VPPLAITRFVRDVVRHHRIVRVEAIMAQWLARIISILRSRTTFSPKGGSGTSLGGAELPVNTGYKNVGYKNIWQYFLHLRVTSEIC
jgi:hypothetical protein